MGILFFKLKFLFRINILQHTKFQNIQSNLRKKCIHELWYFAHSKTLSQNVWILYRQPQYMATWDRFRFHNNENGHWLDCYIEKYHSMNFDVSKKALLMRIWSFFPLFAFLTPSLWCHKILSLHTVIYISNGFLNTKKNNNIIS